MSTEKTIIEQAREVAEEATTTEAFDFTNYLTNGAVTLPEKQVTAFVDIAAGFEITQLKYKIAEKEKEYAHTVGGVPQSPDSGDEELDIMRAELMKFTNRVVDTAALVDMRAAAPKVLTLLRKDNKRKTKLHSWDDEEKNEHFNFEMIRASIVRVTFQKDKVVVEKPFTYDQIEDLMESLPDSEADKIFTMAQILNYGVVLADERVDAGFPGGSADPSPEPDDSTSAPVSIDVEAEAL